MGRFLLLLVLMITTGLTSFSALASDDLFLTPAERALIALTLRLPGRNPLEVKKSVEQAYKAYELSKAQAPQVIEVKSFTEFLKLQSEDKLFTEGNLADLSENELIEKLQPIAYTSPSSRVENKIKLYFENRKAFLQKMSGALGLAGVGAAVLAYRAQDNAVEEIQRFLNQRLDLYLAEMNLQKTPQVQVLVKVIKLYFQHLPISQKSEMAYQISLLPLNAKPMDVFLTMVQNCGPQLQKLVQIKGRADDVPEKFKSVFQKLESQVKKVPWRQVQKVLQHEEISPYYFEYFGQDPLGVGTMAQTHRAQSRKNDERTSFVVRFLKPGMDELLEMDHKILKIIAMVIDSDPEIKLLNLPPLAPFVEDLHMSVVEELVLAKTVKNQNEARSVYNGSEIIQVNGQKLLLRYNVPKAYLFGSHQGLMGQDVVFGKKPAKEIEQYKEIYPDLYRAIAERTASLWMDQAFFKSGFFHADLHQGNVMLSVTESELVLNLLDFGMTGKLAPELQESALLLALGMELQHADLITKHLLRVSKTAGKITEKNLAKAVRDRIEGLKRGTVEGSSFVDWSTWALMFGVEIDYEILKLNRGLSAIEVLLQDSQSPMTIEKIAGSLVMKNKSYLAKILIKEKLLGTKEYSDIAKQAFKSTTAPPLCRQVLEQ